MIRFLRLSLTALAALGAVTAQAPAQTFTLPEIGLQNSGACRQFAVRERDTQTMVPLGCIDTTSKKWTLSPEKLISDSVVAAGTCDTSQWTGYVGGTASPQLQCYASKQSKSIDIPFPAVIGIGPENFGDPPVPVNDQTYIQLAQHLVQAKTTQGNMRQESALVINMDVKTGAGPQTNHGQKVGLYMPVNVHPGAGNTWVMNPAMAILDGVGPQSMYVSEQDMTNFNGPYQPAGSLGNAAQIFRTHLGFPVTSSELWSGHTPPPTTLSVTMTAGSPNITFSGNLHAADKLVAAGLPANTFVQTVNGGDAKVNQTSGSAVLSQPATASGTNVAATRSTYNMFNGHTYQGLDLIRDNTFLDSTGSFTSLNIAGQHQVGVNTTLGAMPYAMLSAAGQKTCFNALTVCLTYDSFAQSLTLSDASLSVLGHHITGNRIYAPGNGNLELGNEGRGPTLTLLDNGTSPANTLTMQAASSGFGPVMRAGGSDSSVPLNLSGKNAPVQSLSGLVVSGGGISAPALPTTGGTVKGTLCVDTSGNIYVKTTAGSCI